MTLAELLALLARWSELDADEATTLNEALADLTAEHWSDEDLTAIRAALIETADDVLSGPQDDNTLAALDFLATVSEAAAAEDQSRADAEADTAAQAQALADRIHATASGDGDDGEPGDGEPGEGDEAGTDGAEGDEAGAGDAGDGDAAGDAEGAETPEAIAAAAAAQRPAPGAARRPAQRRVNPMIVMGTAPLTASANVPNMSMGGRMDPERMGQAIADTLAAMSTGLRDGMKIPLATAHIDFPPEAYLDRDAQSNQRKIEAVTRPAAIAAAGGICAPPTPRYDLPTISVDDRPVRAALTRFGADRGGILLPIIPKLSDLAGAIGLWSEANDRDPGSDGPETKPILEIDCGGDPVHVTIGAITRGIRVANFQARTWAERVDRFLQLAGAQHARVAETKMLTEIGALSKAVTLAQVLGAARDILTALDLMIAGQRSAWRMSSQQMFRLILPRWLLDMMRADLVRELPGSNQERLASADAYIEGFFTVRHVNITWALDGEAGQVFPVQDDGVVVGWPSHTVGYLFPEGEMLFLDGGDLDFGLVRDSTLNAVNKFELRMETFEAVAHYGASPSLRFTIPLCPQGSTSGTVALSCPDSLSS